VSGWKESLSEMTRKLGKTQCVNPASETVFPRYIRKFSLNAEQQADHFAWPAHHEHASSVSYSIAVVVDDPGSVQRRRDGEAAAGSLLRYEMEATNRGNWRGAR
jgi:hypothetical protein